MSNEPIRLCKDCKHVRFTGNGACAEHPVCASPRNSRQVANLVHGGTKTVVIASWCEHQRAWDELDGKTTSKGCDGPHCGRQGWWWEKA